MNWVERDSNVVWHGFTQMECYATNAPVIVERGEGRELIDIDGRRYLDAISSLWVTTLGHRVPELDRALSEQLGRVAHSTLLGNGNRIVIEFAEALARVVPVDSPHVLFASDGACAVEQALKIAFQYWRNRGIAGRNAEGLCQGQGPDAPSSEGVYWRYSDQQKYGHQQVVALATPQWSPAFSVHLVSY